MQWQVGVLRSGAENIAWTHRGDAPGWERARSATIAALRELAAVEGRQEYRIGIDGQPGIVVPGLDPSGNVALDGLDRAIPQEQYWA
ncbi:hypothetical protein [Pseudonocardia sp. KRD291]|uniref:hypothetical protein n=1 Tax=Pseudonocardia sp. KRD291 TaxID=2792007 RepID=UPI001C4A4DFA|nr:hypothetical protein [Pseudonocardia sp. KRD291]MBW0102943.1 hypothetical protein [Pseudonocardia sp. KRD291]